MPKLTVEGVGDFDVPAGKRLVLALTDDAEHRSAARLRRQRPLHHLPRRVRRRRARPMTAGREERAGRPRPRRRRPPQLPDPLRPRHDRARHQPPRRQRPQDAGNRPADDIQPQPVVDDEITAPLAGRLTSTSSVESRFHNRPPAAVTLRPHALRPGPPHLRLRPHLRE